MSSIAEQFLRFMQILGVAFHIFLFFGLTKCGGCVMLKSKSSHIYGSYIFNVIVMSQFTPQTSIIAEVRID